jgi:hypothetical protein
MLAWICTIHASMRFTLPLSLHCSRKGNKPTSELASNFAPVAETASFKILAAIVAHEDLEFENIDVNQAFLCAKHPGKCFVEQPRGYEVQGKENHVILLDVSVYGLPEAPLLWNTELHSYLESKGFQRSPADPCLYSKLVGGTFFRILVYVDDLALAHKSIQVINQFKKEMHDKYSIKDLGPIQKFTSYQISRDRDARTITLHQHDYISEVLELAKMTTCSTISAPPSIFNHLSHNQSPQTEAECAEMKRIPYRATVGALLHIANRTRPDLQFYVSMLARYNSNPGRAHWHALKQLLRYLKYTSKEGLVLGGKKPLELVAYVDSNFAMDDVTRKSTTGFVFLFGHAAVSTKSRLQRAINTSSSEAELTAVFSASQEAIWLRRLLESLDYSPNGPTTIFEDNQGAVKWVHSQESHGRLKHIDIKILALRDWVKKGLVSVKYLPSTENCADMFTKALAPRFILKHRRDIGVQKLQPLRVGDGVSVT